MAESGKWATGPEQYLQKRRQPGTGAAGPARPAVADPTRLKLCGFTWDASAVELSKIQRLDKARARSRFRNSLPDLIWNAAALEGNTFTLPEVRTLLDGVTVGGRPLEDAEQILALSEGYSLLDEFVRDGEFALTKATSDRMHRAVAIHEANLVEELDSFLEYLGSVADPRERALAYFAGATRRQFYFDGNKRTARLMMTGVLLSNGFDAVAIPFARKLEFNIALDVLFETADGTQLMAFMADCAQKA